MVKKGVLGGTFDPVHVGHLALVREVKSYLGLEGVLFVPAGHPRLKETRCISPIVHRRAMLELAVSKDPVFSVSDVETKQKGPNYTVDTMEHLAAEKPDDEWYFILGWDNLVDLPYWKEPQRLISYCRLVAVPRIGWTQPDIEKLEKSIAGLKERVVLMENPRVDVSSSIVRERVARGLCIESLVPKKVACYIKENGLYRKVD